MLRLIGSELFILLGVLLGFILLGGGVVALLIFLCMTVVALFGSIYGLFVPVGIDWPPMVAYGTYGSIIAAIYLGIMAQLISLLISKDPDPIALFQTDSKKGSSHAKKTS